MKVRTVYCLLLGAAFTLGACAPAPIKKPVMGGPVNTGPGSVELVRRQLQGRWTLTSLVTYPAGGAPVTVTATAQLVFDEYGNATLAGRGEGSNAQAATPALQFSGRVVIDPVKQLLAIQDMTGNAPPEDVFRDNSALARIRRFAFEGDTLTLSTLDAAGRVTATTKWQRAK